MQLLINLSIMLALFHLSAAFPHHELDRQQLDKLDKLSYVLGDSELEETSENQENKIRQPPEPARPQAAIAGEPANKYSNLVTRIIKQILSKRTVKASSEHRRRKNAVEQIEKNDLIRSSIIDKKFKLLSELTLRRLKPAFELQLPDMTPEEHDELVNDINKLINEDGSFRRRDGKR